MEKKQVMIPLEELTLCQSLDEWKAVLRRHGVPTDEQGVVVEWIDAARQVHIFEFHPAQQERI